MGRAEGSVRIGPISLFSFIILLCLAVLGVLAITTAHASYAFAEKQADFTSDTYTNETMAQRLVSTVDASLADARSQGQGRDEAMSTLRTALPKEAAIVDNTVQARFLRESGRALEITLAITEDAHYQIAQWQATTEWDLDTSSDTLWSGGANKG